MLRSLHIKNYVLIDSLDVTFPDGLVIITGQTGAGKSIILGALSLLTGAKADASAIMSGQENCVVEAEFDVEDKNGEMSRLMEENEVEWNGGQLTVRRVIHSSGRSRSFINDCPVQLSLLSAISSRMVDIHSQHQSLLLSDKVFQLNVLDLFAGNDGLLKECRESFRRLSSLVAEKSAVEARLGKISAEREYNEAQFRQLEAAKLSPGEIEDLETEQRQLANAEEIKSELFQVESLDLTTSLKNACRSVQRLSSFLPSCDELAQRLESSRIEIDDILKELSAIDSRINLSSDRLQIVDDRLAVLYDLLRKHNCSTVSDLISVRDSLGEILYDSETLNENLETLDKKIALENSRLSEIASELHHRRTDAAPGLAKSITSSLQFLELERAVFDVDIEDIPVSSTGRDSVVFKFSSTGANPVSVSKCASGGEISRIMLCLKALMAKFTNMPTMIFDEIDTGVSGSVADKMGSMICDMGACMQVFAITHLPQVAAKGEAHYLVSKGGEQKDISSMKKLDPDQRVMEIARMLSGSSVTPEAVANAKSLLGDKLH